MLRLSNFFAKCRRQKTFVLAQRVGNKLVPGTILKNRNLIIILKNKPWAYLNFKLVGFVAGSSKA